MTTQTSITIKQSLIDLASVVCVLVLIKQSLLPYSIVWAGPVSTLSAMIVATFCLYRRGHTWATLGFKLPESWPTTLKWTVAVIALIIGTSAIGGSIADLFFEKLSRENRFGNLAGEWGKFAFYFFLIWTHSAFFEELLFRAFLINRLELSLPLGKWAAPVAVLIAAIFFGYRHYYYQGLNGALTTGLIGLSLGFYYIRRGRFDMWPLIIAHGCINTLGFLLRTLDIED
ncbi:CPBP family intramembrane metalloprotease [Temperatibacter marinus]|uniref:CPBP family intramembrane metalloprotease n=1 Tax=Temperatibacter marinus TaxID=1456591 RepID=A0AA52EIB6_9PROT|nr:CPBP family intramembrane glutamic endopeptidase [Temperatibacter marinus]WND02576.1 CPBP family intramembrane metalloprotease [Temperatibacter marinus]